MGQAHKQSMQGSRVFPRNCVLNPLRVMVAGVAFAAVVTIVTILVLAGLLRAIPAAEYWATPIRAIVILGTVGLVVLLFSRLAGKKRMARAVEWLDAQLFGIEWCSNRNDFADPHRCHWLWLPGHSLKVTLLALAVAVSLPFGPTFAWGLSERGIAAYVLGVLAVAMILATNAVWSPIRKWTDEKRRNRGKKPAWWRDRHQFLLHLVILVLLSLVAFFWANEGARERDAGLYAHVLLPALWGLAIAMTVAAFLARLLLGRFGVGQEWNLSGSLRILEIREPAANMGMDWIRLGRSLIKAPFYHPLEILFLPALVVVLVADRNRMERWAFYAGVFTWVTYAAAEMHERLDHALGIPRRMLFLGGQRLVSVLIIVLAAGRMFENSYITTLVEGEGWLVFNNRTLVLYIASAYLYFWYYEYWVNRLVGELLLAALRRKGDTSGFSGAITCAYVNLDAQGTKTSYEHGKLELMGGSRFALLPDAKDGNARGGLPLETYGRVGLLNAIIDTRKVAPSGSAEDLSPDELRLILIHRVRFYFTALTLLLVCLAAGFGAYIYSLPQHAEREARTTSKVEKPFDLQEHLFGEEAKNRAKLHGTEGTERAILVAASGGGTRAALYAYSVLRGLRDLGALHDVVLLSGVSGGSAAIAYFAAHRRALLDLEEWPDAWNRYREVMGAPFIQDALEGVSEWRMLQGCPWGGDGEREGLRLGELLQESFDARFTAEEDQVFPCGCRPCEPRESGRTTASSRPLTLGAQSEVGLIFNTAVAGSFDSSNARPEEGDDPKDCAAAMDAFRNKKASLSQLESECSGGRTSAGKGGRLILTNLTSAGKSLPAEDDATSSTGVCSRLGRAFPTRDDALPGAPGDYLTYKVVNDVATPLVSAAALSANFPPVFPNAAVDVGSERRYWVTDGGASDNRGIISLLYALRHAVRTEHCEYGYGADPRSSEDRKRPVIHIVLAEASAANPGYGQDRGITTTFGAAERFASQMMVSLAREIDTLYRDPKMGGGGIHLHNLTMPLTLRSAGGIGTHWMLPQQVTLHPPPGLHETEARSPWGRLGRFMSFGKPGRDMQGAQAVALVEALNCAEKGSDCKFSERLDKLLPEWKDWICRDAHAPHPRRWSCLAWRLDPESATYASRCSDLAPPDEEHCGFSAVNPRGDVGAVKP